MKLIQLILNIEEKGTLILDVINAILETFQLLLLVSLIKLINVWAKKIKCGKLDLIIMLLVSPMVLAIFTFIEELEKIKLLIKESCNL